MTRAASSGKGREKFARRVPVEAVCGRAEQRAARRGVFVARRRKPRQPETIAPARQHRRMVVSPAVAIFAHWVFAVGAQNCRYAHVFYGRQATVVPLRIRLTFASVSEMVHKTAVCDKGREQRYQNKISAHRVLDNADIRLCGTVFMRSDLRVGRRRQFVFRRAVH